MPIRTSDFNTSHVTVYHVKIAREVFGGKISIHPMLLFIWDFFNLQEVTAAISIHPMLLFI